MADEGAAVGSSPATAVDAIMPDGLAFALEFTEIDADADAAGPLVPAVASAIFVVVVASCGRRVGTPSTAAVEAAGCVEVLVGASPRELAGFAFDARLGSTVDAAASGGVWLLAASSSASNWSKAAAADRR